MYNSPALRALNDLGCQYMYNEVVGEANACFDRMMFLITYNGFEMFKCVVSNMLLATEKSEGYTRNNPLFRAYQEIFRIRNYELIGRNLQLNSLFSKVMNQLLLKNLDVAISLFESKDLSNVQVCKLLYTINLFKTTLNLIKTTKIAYDLFSEVLEIHTFESSFNEIDGRTAFVPNQSRILVHTINELLLEIIPNWCYQSDIEWYFV